MTVKVSVSLPDDVAAWLATQPNASAAVADAIRARVDVVESARQRRKAAIASYHAMMAALPPHVRDDIDAAAAASNALPMPGADW
jgi:hypothetical protein